MLLLRHLKRRASRAPEAGFSTARGNRKMNLSPARRLSTGAGLFLVAAFLVALLVGPAPQAKADFTYGNNITIDKNQVSGSLKHTEQTNGDDAGEWILYKRRVNADVYQNINNPDEFQARIHTVPINYWDGEEFSPIDLAIKEVSDGNYKYEMSAAPYQVYFPESLNSPIKLMSQGKSYEFTLKEMSYNAGEDYLDRPQPTSAVIDDEKVIYSEAFENIDIEYTLRTWGIKEFFVLKEKPRAPADHLTNPTLDFTVTIDAGDLKMYVDGVPATDNFKTDKSIEFVDEASGETVFILPAPYAIDANEEIIQTRYKIKTEENEILIYNQTPYSWLNDPERAYPVRIDPSPATITAGYSVILIGGATWNTIYISSGDWNGDSYRTGIDFDTTVIPDGATIDKVELKLFIDEEDVPLNNDVGKMTKKAYTYHVTDNDMTGFNADVDGNEYLSDSGGFAGLGSHTVELLPAAATDLQSQLGADWFSVGFTGTTEADDMYRDGHTVGEANPPQLIVTYSGVGETSTTLSPGTISMVYDDVLCGNLDKDWKNMPNATASNNLYASFDDKNFDTGRISKRLDLTNFGFAIPAGATLEGVEVEIERHAPAGGAQDEVVHLMLAGSPDTTENKALTSTAWPASDPNSYQSYGGATDKWSIGGLSESDVENSGFGACLCVEATADNTDAYVDHVQITVHYSWPVLLADHAAGQRTNDLSGSSTVTGAQLFGFQLTNETAGVLTVDQVVFQLSSITGIEYTHFDNLKIYVDADNDGEIETGEDIQVGGAGAVEQVNPPTTITFSTDFDISASTTVNYILKGDVSNLEVDDTVTIDLGTSNVTLTSGTVGGSNATGVTHTYCGDGKFSYRRSIVIDHTKVGADDSGSLPDDTPPNKGFPVLISLSGSGEPANWLKHKDQGGHIESADGYDIIFRESDGETNLYHEIEDYDGTNGTLVAWVRIDSLSKETDTTIYMYYGNACITSATEDPENVWDDNYKGVWHMKEEATGIVTDDLYIDSTSNSNDGDDRVSAEGQDGKISSGQQFDGNNDYVGMGNVLDYGKNDPMTYSAWIKTSGTFMQIAGKADHDSWHGVWFYLEGAALGFFLYDAATNDKYKYSTETFNDNQWHHVAATYDGSDSVNGITLYGDGLELGISGTQNDTLGTVKNSYPFNIGAANDGASDQFNGYIDEVRLSSAPRDADWIKTEYNNQVWPDKAVTPTPDPSPNPASGFYTVGGEESNPATAVSLLSFTATGQDDSVRVSWETAREIDNMGFYLYRATSPWGPFTRLTDKLIPGLTFSVVGKTYTYEDTNVTPGKLYYYRLEDIDVHGKRTFHGPICVDWDGDGMPDDWEIAHGLDPAFDDSGIDLDGDGLTNLEEYEWATDPLNPDTDGDGIPDGREDGKINKEEGSETRTITKGVQIVASDETGITLELRTDAFDMRIVENEGEAFERLRILDYIHGFTTAVGKPELPMKGILIDLPEGKSATLQVKETEGQTLSGYWVYPVPEKAVHGEGDLAHVAEIFAMDEAAYSTDVFYPNELARLGQTYIFRGWQKHQVIFYPLAFNPGTRELMHYTRIRVRVTYEDAQERSLMAAVAGSPGLRALAWTPPSVDSAYKILVSEEGIYRITAGDVDGMDLSQVRLYNLGQEVAISVHDGAGDDYIEFYGRPVDAQYAKYATYNVYWLTTSGGSGSPKRMEEIDGTPGSAAVADTHTFTVHYEEDLGYWILAPGGDSLDRWFFFPSVMGDGVEYGGDPVDFTLSLPGVAGAGTGKLTISMGGYYDTDHEVDVSVNGTPVGTFTWSGIAFYQATMDDVDLLEGDNTVTIECKTSIDTIVVDWFEVEYPRDFAAINDLLKFSFDAGYRYQISGFTGSDPVAFDITSPGDVQRITGSTSDTSPCTLYFENPGVTGERTYLALSSDAVETPSGISQDTASTLSDQANGADYILITHRDLGWDGNGDPNPWLSDLEAFRQAQDLRVRVVDVADIYDEFSYGIASPQAVKDFLAYAYNNWTQPAPQYVLLVGDSTYDPKNNWSSYSPLLTDTTTYLPAYLTFTTSIDYMGETVTDEWFVRISGDDAIPDMYIGRLPAVSVDQATVMVNKIITYETTANTKTWEKNVLLIADNQVNDYEVVFETMNEDAAALIPTGLNAPFKGYLGDYVSEAYLTVDIKAKINEGTIVVNYSGHGSTQIWAHEHIFDSGDVADLTNGDKLPFFVSMSCLTGYFADPETWNPPSLVEVLVRSEGKGAVAAFMPTGMTGPEGQHILDAALFDAIFTEDIRTLGPAVSSAKQTLLANGVNFAEFSETFLLFGDPAMTLKIPIPRRPSGLVAQGQAGGAALEWQEAVDCNGGAVSGYNLYRSTTSGGDYTKANLSLITGTEYDDTGLEEGTTYYFVITSVDSDGDESVRSQEASATPTALDDGDTPGTPDTIYPESSDGACFISSLFRF